MSRPNIYKDKDPRWSYYFSKKKKKPLSPLLNSCFIYRKSSLPCPDPLSRHKSGALEKGKAASVS